MNVDPNSVGTNSKNYSNVVKQSQLPVMLDLVNGTFKVKGDRHGFKMGFLEAKGNTAQELMADIASKAKNTRTQTKRAARLSASAKNASRKAQNIQSTLRNKKAENERFTYISSLPDSNNDILSRIKQSRAAIAKAEAKGENTTFLTKRLEKEIEHRNLQNRVFFMGNKRRKAEIENISKKANMLKKAAANAKAEANKLKKPSAIGRLFGFTRRSVRKSKHGSRRQSRRQSRRN